MQKLKFHQFWPFWDENGWERPKSDFLTKNQSLVFGVKNNVSSPPYKRLSQKIGVFFQVVLHEFWPLIDAFQASVLTPKSQFFWPKIGAFSKKRQTLPHSPLPKTHPSSPINHQNNISVSTAKYISSVTRNGCPNQQSSKSPTLQWHPSCRYPIHHTRRPPVMLDDPCVMP